jgi:DNA-directed RNA polymerase specialized sigma24 family protein
LLGLEAMPARFRSATPGGVARLYRRFGPAIYSSCLRLLKDDALAEHATQEVFVSVRHHLESAPDDAAALEWVYRISTRYCRELGSDRPEPGLPGPDLAT